jgi:predicted amidophosphoribosyltransferase
MSLLLRAHLLIFPPSCHGCQKMMDSRAAFSREPPPGFPFLCPDCHAALPWRNARREAGQARRVQASETIAGVDRLWVACRYEAPVSDWVRAFKYGGQDRLAPLLSRVLGEATRAAALAAGSRNAVESIPESTSQPGKSEEFDLSIFQAVVPVPLHPRRLRRRGFNQSLLLAHRWLRELHAENRGERAAGETRATAPPPLRAGWLARRRDTRPQVELDGTAREQNVEGAFMVPPAREEFGESSPPLAGQRVLLVDDVATTGSTLSACAHALTEAGAARVEALVLARA